jgi:hypothetical protein
MKQISIWGVERAPEPKLKIKIIYSYEFIYLFEFSKKISI